MSGMNQKPLNYTLETGELNAMWNYISAELFGKKRVCPMQHLAYTYTKTLFSLRLKFTFHWAFCVLSGDPTYSRNQIM